MEIKGLKKAVGEYKRYNAGGAYSPEYAELMYDKADGTLWTDYFYCIGHNQFNIYQSDSIINLGRLMAEQGVTVSMSNVLKFVEQL